MAISEQTIAWFMEMLGSKSSTPGGGSAAALTGAMGVSLTKMVGELTVNHKKYETSKALMVSLLEETEKIQTEFLQGIEKDIQAFDAVMAVYQLKNTTDEEKHIRHTTMQEALKNAALPPFELMSLSVASLRLTRNALGKSNLNVISDLGVAALNLKAALQSSWLNVLINLNGIRDQAFVEYYHTKGEALLMEGSQLADTIYQEVLKTFE